MFSAKEHFKQRLEAVSNKINTDLDFDFSAVSKRIDTLEQFENELVQGYYSSKQFFYRGERTNDTNRHLLPTMLRNTAELFEDNELGFVHIDADYIYDYYSSLGSFLELFNKTMDKTDKNSLYNICAFAQHYYHKSPLIDFTKSIYPSLSFALKDRNIFDDDIVLYVLELKSKEDYTTDINTANKWLSEINIYASCFDEADVKAVIKEVLSNKSLDMSKDFKRHIDQLNTPPIPKAKLIDVPTNTRMKFQQGVFLMLTDFHLYNVRYFTKNIREQFEITKYIINKEICPEILKMIKRDAPWYSYKYLTDVESAFKKAVEE